MLLRSAPLSKEVSLPVTSTTETCPTCRMVAEKFTVYLLMGTPQFYLRWEGEEKEL